MVLVKLTNPDGNTVAVNMFYFVRAVTLKTGEYAIIFKNGSRVEVKESPDEILKIMSGG